MPAVHSFGAGPAQQQLRKSALMKKMRPTPRPGFTLIELLTVITIIGVLLGLLMPAVKRRRGLSRCSQCKNNLRQMGIAFLHFESAKRGFPPRRHTTVPYQGWGPYLLHYLEENPLGDRYDLTKNFYDPVNQPVIAVPLPVFVCPSAPPDRTITIIDQSNNPTGAVGAVGDYFAANSFDAYWWPAAQKAAAEHGTVHCPAAA